MKTAAAILAAAVLLGLAGDTRQADASPVVRIEEDSAAWDCRTMGNRRCDIESPAWRRWRS